MWSQGDYILHTDLAGKQTDVDCFSGRATHLFFFLRIQIFSYIPMTLWINCFWFWQLSLLARLQVKHSFRGPMVKKKHFQTFQRKQSKSRHFWKHCSNPKRWKNYCMPQRVMTAVFRILQASLGHVESGWHLPGENCTSGCAPPCMALLNKSSNFSVLV